ncbi:hypothetical protein [Mycobacteroides abscessus]|uniref:hypothetical protein n=1 Tax=Mycobacteroides abscessus TaxID=36809 RepID=UPI0009A62613|nr:hypothetical protein [Mycobacteroides abscessus]SKU62945.1 Uncharacterised protein [Mycobacteroides abscessus subsp. massiliense]
MTRNQRQALAFAVINRAADLSEFWTELIDDELEGVDREEAIQTIADWLGRLPGNRWDLRLPQPSYLADKSA